MKLYMRIFLLSFLVLILISGCVSQKKVAPVNTEFFQEKLEKPFEKKMDNFLVILDRSESMWNPYNGIKKFEFEKKILAGMNETFPDIKVKGAIRVFGKAKWIWEKLSVLVYGVTDYSKEDFAGALEKLEIGQGNSFLAVSIDSAKEDLISLRGKTAVIIFSDGVGMSNAPFIAARQMKMEYGENVCFYTVLIGNDAKGGRLLEDIARVGECGFFEKGDNLISQEGMQNFVKKIFLTPSLDSDGDGVADYLDECPNTPRNVKVDSRGCRIIPKSFVLLLKNPDGTTGAVTVSNEKGARKLDRAGYAVGMDDTGEMPGEGFEIKEEAIHELFQKTMEAQPKSPITFILYFQTDSIKLIKESEEELKKVLPAVEKWEVPNVEVTGHSDRAGNEEYNYKLALKRASIVRDLLVKKGLDTYLIEVYSHGENNPLVDTPDGVPELRNRRVEVIVR